MLGYVLDTRDIKNTALDLKGPSPVEESDIMNAITVCTKCYGSISERGIVDLSGSYCCITKHPKLGLQTATINNFSHV